MRCVVIGDDSLLIECVERLRQRGHEVVAVATDADRVRTWAQRSGLASLASAGSDWIDAADALAPDWLFAITHLRVLPARALRVGRRGAVNFHDGPLPDYAGLHAPAWALLHGERSYGITWHLMSEEVDAGDVLVQRRFDLADDETSVSLNTRNFDAALESFDEVLALLEAAGDARPAATPQSSLGGQRRTFRRYDLPAGGGVLDLSRPAADLDRTVRALDFGRYRNPLGCATLVHGDRAVVVEQARVGDEPLAPAPAPGTVLHVGDSLDVATGDGRAWSLVRLGTAGGQALTADEAAAHLGIRVGDRLDLPTAADLAELDRALARAIRDESAHVDRRRRFAPTRPWSTRRGDPQQPPVHVPVVLPAEVSADAARVTAIYLAALARLTGQASVGIDACPTLHDDVTPLLDAVLDDRRPLQIEVDLDAPLATLTDAVRTELAALEALAPSRRDLVRREPALRTSDADAAAPPPFAISLCGDPVLRSPVELVVHGSGAVLRHRAEVDPADVRTLAEVMCVMATAADGPVGGLPLVDTPTRDRMIDAWNETGRLVPDTTIHQLVDAVAARHPGREAVVDARTRLDYATLADRVHRLAHHLRASGLEHGQIVGVHLGRSVDLVVAVLAVLEAGGAYLPLDPTYPADRLVHMLDDSGCGLVVTDTHHATGLPTTARPLHVVRLDADRAIIDARPGTAPEPWARPDDVAYCIYTSGTTGGPKGVLVEHRNVVNFFVGMDDVVDLGAVDEPGGVRWLAVTSLSFDISVLELLYTLTRGCTVVVHDAHDDASAAEPRTPAAETSADARPIDFSLFYFSGDESESTGIGKYRLLLDGARFADANGFAAVWTPERHFHGFGGLYPQPAITGAAVAAVTEHVQIRAGSVVLPLHHPIRVAEEWGVVDNLSNGRVALGIAAGWQPNDFVLFPQNRHVGKAAMYRDLEVVQRLWRGETVAFDGPDGNVVEVRTLPRPVQPELTVWITTAGNPDTYVEAGRMGANVLTHLLGQSVEQLAEKIQLYRAARAEAGFDPDGGTVSLMLHTFVGDDVDAVRDLVREPLKQYLATSVNLLSHYAWSFPAFAKRGDVDEAVDSDMLASLTPEDADAIVEFGFRRYFETSGLFGTPRSCLAMVDRLKAIGVDDIACLIDFGVPTDTVLAHLPHLAELRRRANEVTAVAPTAAPSAGERDLPGERDLAADLVDHRITHFQCTPSMARMLTLDERGRAALAGVQHLYVGGEALPVALAEELLALRPGAPLTNMYGPTETTIWSTTWPVAGPLTNVPIGAPIANTSVYVLDARQQLLPPGVPGELWIGGLGVVRGYHERPELTADRFRPDPFRAGVASGDAAGNAAGVRMYRTGDLVAWRPGAATPTLDFLGRVDHQVKLRGHRIELGEIETWIGRSAGVRECVVVVDGAADVAQLVAFVSESHAGAVDPGALRASLREHLPEIMVPAHVVALDDLPHTPNGKIDRKALPSLADVGVSRTVHTELTAPQNASEQTVLEVWQEIMGTAEIGIDDNFFDIGGHSLLVVRLHRRLRDALELTFPLIDLYRFPTVRSFAASLAASAGDSAAIRAGSDRAARRRERLGRRA